MKTGLEGFRADNFFEVVTVQISGHSFLSAGLISEWIVCMFVI